MKKILLQFVLPLPKNWVNFLSLLSFSLYTSYFLSLRLTQIVCQTQRGTTFLISLAIFTCGMVYVHPGLLTTMNLQRTVKFLKHSREIVCVAHSRFILDYLCILRTLRHFLWRIIYAGGTVGFRPKFEIAGSYFLSQNYRKILSFKMRIWCRYEARTSNFPNSPFTYQNDK